MGTKIKIVAETFTAPDITTLADLTEDYKYDPQVLPRIGEYILLDDSYYVVDNIVHKLIPESGKGYHLYGTNIIITVTLIEKE